MHLDDKVALITGSDSGIGRATAIAFAREGADLVVTYRRDADGAAATAAEVEAAGRRALTVAADVTDEAAVEAMFDRAIEAFGRVDILVNNAGVNGTGTDIVDMDTATWDRAMRTNLYGYFFCARRFARERRSAGGGGKLINVTSIHDEAASPGNAEYDTTKGGQRMFTRTLALELAPLRINVNAIGPGMILTPMNRDAVEDPALAERQAANIPWRRPGTPEDIARLAIFLASPDAAIGLTSARSAPSSRCASSTVRGRITAGSRSEVIWVAMEDSERCASTSRPSSSAARCASA